MANPEKKIPVSKKHRARVQRERIQRRNITIATVVILVAVVGVTVAGFVLEGVIKPNQPMVEVNDTTITTKEFLSYASYQRYLVVTEYINTYQYLQSFGDQSAFSFFESYLLQLQNELEPGVLGLSVIDSMVENVLIAEHAAELDIQVSEAEVKSRVDELIFQYYPDGTPTPAPTEETYATPTLSALQMVLVPPTPSEAGADPEPLEPTEAVIEPTAVLPTPTVYTEKAYNTNYKDFMSYLKTSARVTEETLFAYYQAQILRERVAEAVITDIPSDEEVLWARHILFQDETTGEQQAIDFLARIDAGEDFVTLAEELSALPEGSTEEGTIRFEDLGWFGDGQLVAGFETAAKGLEVGEISQAVNTSFGWHVIQLLGRDTRPRSQADMDQLRQTAFQDWLNTQRVEAKVNINTDWISAVPVDPDIPEQIKIQAPDLPE